MIFYFRKNKDGDPMIFDEDNSIGGMINNVGTMILSFSSGKKRDEFKKYCEDNDIKISKFLDSDEILVTNYKDFEIKNLPKDLISESTKFMSFDDFCNQI